MTLNQVLPLVKETYARWSEHQAPRLGASVAFYSILSFAPLLILLTAVIALIFGHESAQASLVNEARQWIGDRGAETVESLLKSAQKPSSGFLASAIAFLTLLFGASGVFSELQDALNIMWDAPPKTAAGLAATVRQRLFSFGMVLSVGFLLLISLILSSALAYFGKFFGDLLPIPAVILQIFNFLVSFAVVAVLFALMFKYLPTVSVPWRDVVFGATSTAVLFTIGKFLLGVYLGKASVGSTYGAAGSLVAVVVWIYYSAQIFFFGAELTRVYAQMQKPASAVNMAAIPTPPSPQQASQLPSALTSSPATASIPLASRTAEPAGVAVSSPKPPLVILSKPSLLAVLAVGFVLGRLVGASAKHEVSADESGPALGR